MIVATGRQENPRMDHHHHDERATIEIRRTDPKIDDR
jgi:hypothetical protein